MPVVPLLGFWNVVKQGAIVLWKTFLHEFIAPAFHCLFPAAKV